MLKNERIKPMELSFKKPKVVIDELERSNGNGIYYIRLINQEAFKDTNESFNLEYISRNHPEVIYIGKATGPGGLYKRLGQELQQEGRATFFRSIGAIIGAVPRERQDSPNNYMFFGAEEEKVISFINQNLEVAYQIIYDSAEVIENVEQLKIKEFEPIINILHNPNPSQTLREARKRCIRIAGTGTNKASLNSDEGITSKQKRIVNRKGQIID